MSSFQAHFSNLYYNGTYEESQMIAELESNDSMTPGFCGSPDDDASSKICGSGAGTGAASLIGSIVSAVGFGAIFGSLFSAWISDWMSRKYGLMFGSAVSIVGAGVAATAYHGYEWMLLLGRLLSGFAMGLFYAIMPVYLAEATPKDSRGLLTSMIGPMYGLGFMTSLLANIGWAEFDLGWRLSIGGMVVIGLVAFIGLKFIPHSPRWLAKKKRDQEALMILSKINHRSKSETFLDTYLELESLRESIKVVSGSKLLAVKEFSQWKYVYRFLLTSCLFALEGVGIFSHYYASTLFCEVGVSPFIAAVVVGVVVLSSSILTTVFVDKIGRRVLFLACTLLTLSSSLAVAVLTQLCSSSGGIVSYAIVVLFGLFTFGYSCSWLTLPWVINSEVFPNKIRGLTAGIATSIYWLSTFVTTLITPLILSSPIDVDGFMYIIAGLNLLGLLLVFFALPETKGVSLEEMDKLFSKSFWQRFKEDARCNSAVSTINELELQDKKDWDELANVHSHYLNS